MITDIFGAQCALRHKRWRQRGGRVPCDRSRSSSFVLLLRLLPRFPYEIPSAATAEYLYDAPLPKKMSPLLGIWRPQFDLRPPLSKNPGSATARIYIQCYACEVHNYMCIHICVRRMVTKQEMFKTVTLFLTPCIYHQEQSTRGVALTTTILLMNVGHILFFLSQECYLQFRRISASKQIQMSYRKQMRL